MLDSILNKAPFFLLVYARCFALLLTLPLFSMRSVPRRAKLALSFYMTFLMLPSATGIGYEQFLGADQAFSIEFIMLVMGEVLIGIIMGFFVQIVFAAFSTAGQFFAFQMGFSAASAYDALSQVENPLMGQFLNFIAMLIFMQNRWFQKLFVGGLMRSYESLNALNIVNGTETIARFMLKGLSNLFADALIIALPVMGTLLLISVATGLLSKAAPQMNLLSEGFPIMILLAFFLILSMLPSMTDFFMRSFEDGMNQIMTLVSDLGSQAAM